MWNQHSSKCNSCSANSQNILGCSQDSWMIFPTGNTVHTMSTSCKSMQAGKCTGLFQLISQWSPDAEWGWIQYLIYGVLKVCKWLLFLACFSKKIHLYFYKYVIATLCWSATAFKQLSSDLRAKPTVVIQTGYI